MGIATHDSLMSGIRQSVEAVLRSTGTPASQATQAGEQVAQRLAAAWINCVIHIPQGVKYRAMLRNKQIFDRFTGQNHASLALEFGFSIQHIYQVIRSQRLAYIQERQRDLFDVPDAVNNQDVSTFLQAKLYILADIMDHASAVLCEFLHIRKAQADEYGEQIANWMSEHWGGQSAYIKSGKNEQQTGAQQGLFQ